MAAELARPPASMSGSEHQPSNVASRLATVRARIAAVAERIGRDQESIALIAVSKRKPVEDIVAAYEAGQRDFGENYVQEFASKHERLLTLDDARFHFIGKLQSNKAAKAARLFSAVHTVDSAKLARRLDRFGKPLEVFLEVKLSPEDSKSGMDAALLESVIEDVAAAPNLRLAGLMTMPPWNSDPEHARAYFRRLRELAQRHGVNGLSMGMSHDLEVAIEEGATHVRIGTAIFGPRDPLPG